MPFISRPDIKSASLASVTLLYIHENEKKDSQEEEEEKKKHKKVLFKYNFCSLLQSACCSIQLYARLITNIHSCFRIPLSLVLDYFNISQQYNSCRSVDSEQATKPKAKFHFPLSIAFTPRKPFLSGVKIQKGGEKRQ